MARTAKGRAKKPAKTRTAARAARPAPSDKPLWKRFFLKPGMTLGVVGAPPGYTDMLGSPPQGVTVRDSASGASVIHAFATDAAALRACLTEIAPALGADTALWLSYPKTDSAAASDLSREAVWEVAEPFGLRPVAQVSVDATWSALRFKKA